MPRYRNGICQLLQFWRVRPSAARSKLWVSSIILAIICFNFFAILIFSASVFYKNDKRVAVWVQNDPAGTNNEAPSIASRMLNSILINITDNTPDEIVASSIISAILNKFKDKHGNIPQSLLKPVLAMANLTFPQPISVEKKGQVPEKKPEPVQKSPIQNFGLPEPPVPHPVEENDVIDHTDDNKGIDHTDDNKGIDHTDDNKVNDHVGESKATESKQAPSAVVKETSSADKDVPEKHSTSNVPTNQSLFEPLHTRKPEKLPEKKEGELHSCIQYSQQFAVGDLKPLTEEITPEKLAKLFPQVREGGHYSPTKCIAKEKTAILIPYRNRYSHLHILLHNLIPLLLRQEIDFTIFVIDQALPDPFNRGMLFNVGFLEALKRDKNFDCFIYHDVDLIPINYGNYYHCNEAPTHFLAGVDKYRYKLLYSNMFGGVTAFTKEQFKKINGASNLYFGWGGEDDDLHRRVTEKGYTPLRTSNPVGFYNMIKHDRDSKNDKNPSRGAMLKTATKRIDVEGLNTTKYTTLKVEALPMYTWVSVNINFTEVLATAPKYMRKEIEKLRRANKETDKKA